MSAENTEKDNKVENNTPPPKKKMSIKLDYFQIALYGGPAIIFFLIFYLIKNFLLKLDITSCGSLIKKQFLIPLIQSKLYLSSIFADFAKLLITIEGS